MESEEKWERIKKELHNFYHELPVGQHVYEQRLNFYTNIIMSIADEIMTQEEADQWQEEIYRST